MGIRGLLDDGTKEKRVLEQPLNGLNEEGGQVPCMGEVLGKFSRV